MFISKSELKNIENCIRLLHENYKKISSTSLEIFTLRSENYRLEDQVLDLSEKLSNLNENFLELLKFIRLEQITVKEKITYIEKEKLEK